MNIPQFTGQSSLYRSSRHYRSAVPLADGPSTLGEVVPAYMPGPDAMRRCNDHIEGCIEDASAAASSLSAVCAIASAACGPFYPVCLATCLGGVVAAMDLQILQCTLRQVLTRCCPKVCGPLNPFVPGEGCCDTFDTCVSRNDPNSRQGCCPPSQSVCAGKCCPPNHFCCGDSCCPSGYFCRDGSICEKEFIGQFPNTPPPTPPPGNKWCRYIGGSSCGEGCCRPGLECCGVHNGQPICQTSCLH